MRTIRVLFDTFSDVHSVILLVFINNLCFFEDIINFLA